MLNSHLYYMYAVPPGSSNSNYESTESDNGDSDILELLEVIFHDLQLAVISMFLLEVSTRSF